MPTPHGASGLLIIGVRSEREFLATAVDSAINLPLPQLEHHIRDLVTDKVTPLLLYCASGARSGIACTMLKQLGYSMSPMRGASMLRPRGSTLNSADEREACAHIGSLKAGQIADAPAWLETLVSL